MTPKRSLLIIFACILLLCGCGGDDVVYSEFHDHPSDGWRRMTVLSFDPCPFDSATDIGSHEIEIILRHNDAIPYDSLWVAVEETSFGTTIHRDTIPVALSNAEGEWLGRGTHGVYEVSKSLRTYKRLPSGYEITLGHAMKQERIPGIINVGIRMKRFNNHENR